MKGSERVINTSIYLYIYIFIYIYMILRTHHISINICMCKLQICIYKDITTYIDTYVIIWRYFGGRVSHAVKVQKS